MMTKPKDGLNTQTDGKGAPRDKMKLLTYVASFACALTFGAVAFAAITVSNSQAALAKFEAETTPVVIANELIAAGTTIAPEAVSVVDVPRTYAANEATTTIEDVIGKVASSDIPANGQIAQSSLAGTLAASSLSVALEPNKVATSVSVDAQSGVAGLLHQGDYVDILAEGSIIVERVRVLALDASLSENTGEYATVTVELSVEDACNLQNAQTNADVRFVLHSEVD